MKTTPDTCARIQAGTFYQEQIWPSQGTAYNISALPDGHLDNVIRWIREHADHTQNNWPVNVEETVLMERLVEEQQKRIPVRNKTARQAVKDVLLNEYVVAGANTIDQNVDVVLRGLRKRGFDVTRIRQ